jgi:hypothetical protein
VRCASVSVISLIGLTTLAISEDELDQRSILGTAPERFAARDVAPVLLVVVEDFLLFRRVERWFLDRSNRLWRLGSRCCRLAYDLVEAVEYLVGTGRCGLGRGAGICCRCTSRI